MHKGLLDLHSLLRWVLLVMMIITIIDSLRRMYKPMDERERKIAMFTMIVLHTQLLIGLIIYLISPIIRGLMAEGKVMNHDVSRFWVVEHFAGMLIAAILVTVGYRRAKNQDRGWAKHRIIFFYYLAAFIIILLSIPWPWRDIGIARPWF